MKIHLRSFQAAFLFQFSSSSLFYMVGLGLLFLAGLSGNTTAASAQANGVTDINVGTTVKTPNAKRLGINLSGQSFYDSGQMLRNVTFRNPGFEGEIWRSVLKCKTVVGNGCYADDPWSSWPANFLQGGTVQFITGASKGLTGTISGVDAANTSSNVSTLLHMSGLAHAPTAGDYYVVQATIPGNPQAGWWPSTSGGATLTANRTDLSPHSPGKQALQMNATASGQSASVASYFDTMNGRSFLQLNGTYTVSFRAKGLGGSNSLSVNVSRQTSKHGAVTYLNQNVQLTNQWQDYTFSFQAREDGSYIGVAGVTFAISGGSALLDDAAVTEEAASDNPTPFRNAVVDRLRELHPGVLRYMDNGTDFGSTIDNMIAVPFARQRAGYSQNSAEQDDIPIGLVEFLQLCQAIDAEPWFTVPNAVSTTEMQNLIQFLNGDASTKYGALRASLGQSAPWTSVFPVIHLELGNENWNTGSFPGETINDPVATGQRAQQVFTAARQAPEYDASKFDLIMNGWAVVPWYNQQELLQTSAADTIDVAPYTFNAFNDYGSNEAIYGSMFAEPEAVDSLSNGYMYQQMQTAAAASHPVKLAVYEVNLSTVSGTASQNLVNQVVPSVGAGLSTVEHMLLMMRDDGVTLQNMFALPEYANGFNNTNGGGGESTPLWGTVIDMGGATNQCRPQFLAEELANTAISGNLLETIQTGANPTWNQPTNNNTKIATPKAHYLQSFAFSDGSNNGVIVFNLHRTSALPVTFSGANAPKGTVKIGQLTSRNPTDNNEQNNVVANTNTTVNNFDPKKNFSLPPFSMTVFTWGGDSGTSGSSAQSTNSQLTASPLQTTAGQAVTLSAAVTAGSGTPDGSVSFLDGSTPLGSASLVQGKAAVTTTSLPAGVHTLTVKYQGSSSYEASTSAAVAVSVATAAAAKGTTSTALSTRNGSVTTGSPLSFAIAVSGKNTSAPSGSVSISLNGTSFGSAKLTGGKATVSGKAPAAGTYAAVAQYAGDSSNAGSTSNSISVPVKGSSAVATTTTLTPSVTKLNSNQPLTLNAAVSATGGASVPTGSVIFYLGNQSVGTASLAAGKASVSITGPSDVGPYRVSAKYQGNAADSGSSSGDVAISVAASQSQTATSTTVSVNPTSAVQGQNTVLSARVSPSSGTTTPIGRVQFLLGTNSVGWAALSSGVASVSVPAPAAGVYQLSARYAGSSAANASTSSNLQWVVSGATASAVATTTQMQLSKTNVTVGDTIGITVAVASANGKTIPKGTITIAGASATLGPVSPVNGKIALRLDATKAGVYTLLADFNGDGKTSSSSKSKAVVLTVNQAVTAGPGPVPTPTPAPTPTPTPHLLPHRLQCRRQPRHLPQHRAEAFRCSSAVHRFSCNRDRRRQ